MQHKLYKKYNQKIVNGEISFNQAQKLVIEKLVAICEYAENLQAEKMAKKGFYGKITSIFQFCKKIMLANQSDAICPQAPKQNKQGLYIYGDVGRGKSMLMGMFYESLNISNKAKKRLHFSEFMIEIHNHLNRLREQSLPENFDYNSSDKSASKVSKGDFLTSIARELASHTGVICLDELQITDIADAMIVGRLFKNLFELGVIIIITSNRIPQDLYKNGLQRERFLPFIDVIKSKLHIENLGGKIDYREEIYKNYNKQTPTNGKVAYSDGKQSIKGNSTKDNGIKNNIGGEIQANWFVPSDDSANTKFIQEKIKRYKAIRTEQVNLTTKGREISLKNAYNINDTNNINASNNGSGCGSGGNDGSGGEWKLLVIDFSELCGRPLSSEDYHKIAEYFKVIILQNIPKFNKENSPEAIRFLKLIDAFYEANIKLICTATGSIANLVEENLTGEIAFALPRTISRIKEMMAR